MNSKRITIILIGILLIQGCGLKFWYNRLDWVASWYIDDYVELTGKQEEAFEQLVRQKLEWHRASQLPLYVSILKNMTEDINQGTFLQNYPIYDSKVESFFDNLVREISSDLAAQMSQLTDVQVNELITTLEKSAAKRHKKFIEMSLRKKQKKSIEDIEDSLKEWVGRLKKSQKTIVKQWAKEIKPTQILTHTYRSQWRQAIVLAMNERHTDSGKASITSLLTNPQQLLSIELKTSREYNRKLARKYILQIYPTLTKKQLKKLLRKLNNYKEDFEELIED